MKRQVNIKALLLIPALLVLPQLAGAAIQGITGTSFSLTAKAGPISTGDGNSMLVWSFADSGITGTGQMQYPGPTLILEEDVEVTVTLSNNLPAGTKVSLVFPGQSGVTTEGGGVPGLMTQEVESFGSTVTYRFTPTEPGTYMYQSGTQPEIQLEMGLAGAIIVRPTDFDEGTPESHPDRRAYAGPGSRYDREYLFFLSEMDRDAHAGLDGGIPLDPAGYDPSFWFINGRNGLDTLYPDGAGWLPAQPYGALALGHTSDRILIRYVGAGRDLHPFHPHGNNTWLIAQDGRVLESAPGAEAPYPDFIETDPGDPDWLPNGATLPDQSISNYTQLIAPGSTYDAIFTLTFREMNWDIYGDREGHRSTDAVCDETTRIASEDPNSHCKEFPISLPEQQALTFGVLWSGSPYLGSTELLPPLEGGLNPTGGFSYIWHSHTEKELANDDIFPGGMLTFYIVVDDEIPLD